MRKAKERLLLEWVGVPEPVPCDELTGLDIFHINRCGEGYYSLKALVSGSSNVREVLGYKHKFFSGFKLLLS